MGTILETEFAALDFESAGARPGGSDHPVQAGIAVFSGGSLRPDLNFMTYIASPEPVTWSAARVHGITTRDLAGAPSMAQLWPDFKRLLAGRWIVAHGASTEKRFLRAFPFHGFGPWVDTLKLARAVHPGLPSHALGDLAHHYGLVPQLEKSIPGFRWHDALSDAFASLALLDFYIREWNLGGEPAEILLTPDDGSFHRNKSWLPFR